MKDKSFQLMNIGVDVEGVVRRLGGSEDLYLRICSKFIADTNHQLFQQAIDREDYTAAEIYIHTLKGVAANLGFLYLERISETILSLLRNQVLDSLPYHRNLLSKEYQRIISILVKEN